MRKQMLAITWKEYLTSVALLVGLYYVVVLIWTNRIKLKKYIKAKLGPGIEGIPIDDDEEEQQEESEAFEELERIVDWIRDSMTGMAGENGTSKDELLLKLRETLSGYDGLRRPAFQEAVTHFIIEHAKEICGVVFSEEELKAEWKSLPR